MKRIIKWLVAVVVLFVGAYIAKTTALYHIPYWWPFSYVEGFFFTSGGVTVGLCVVVLDYKRYGK